MNDQYYLKRCIVLAAKGLGNTAPNPLVGSVIVYNDSIIGEGYHERYGRPHAEVNAINQVANKNLLSQSTLYVNLEPCSHYGKTPPCANLIIDSGIPRVVIGSADPFPEVSGKGIALLKSAGIEVIVGVLEKECLELNKRFYQFYTKHQPYIILKWAQTMDGFIARLQQDIGDSLKITNKKTNQLVHQWRSEEQAILVGKYTILKDDPILNVRLVNGKQPIPMVMAQKQSIPSHYKIHQFNPHFFENKESFKQDIINHCNEHKIQSILVEGGTKTLQLFIDHNFWNEARIITNTSLIIENGIAAPVIPIPPSNTYLMEEDNIEIIFNTL
jgi:diaminohydroxyphosphoribosylaminopyrimidine deaminase/5-amino-6-(5-phosphoribosylamino)uracil reductase